MKQRMALWFSVVLFLSTVSASRPIQNNPILARFLITPKSAQAMDAIANQFEVTAKRGVQYEVLVPRQKIAAMTALTSQANELEADTTATINDYLDNSLAANDSYRNYAQVEAQLRDWATTYPDLVHLETYGQTAQGRPLYVLKLSDDVGSDDESEKNLVLTAATHGDELITVETLLGLIKILIEGYGKDARLTKMATDHQLFFIPVVNPDGFVRRERYSNGVDPNREYPWPESPNRDPETSIAAIMEFFTTHRVAGSIDFHAYGELIMFPWGYTRAQAEHFDWYTRLVNSMAEHNHYTAGPIATTIYIAKGSSADYYHWKLGIKALAIEVATSKVPNPTKIPEIIQDNSESTWRFIESF